MGNDTKPTLRSRSTARVLDAISEGEIWGLLDGDKSIYLNGTALRASGGGYNFRGVRTYNRPGTANQSTIPGFRRVVNEINNGRQIEHGSPVTFDILDEDIDAVLLKLRIGSLFKQTNKGKMKKRSVKLEIDIRPNGGSYSQVATVNIRGRTTSQYDRQKRIAIPEGNRPYTVRIRRVTPDSVDSNLQNDTFLPSYTLVTDWRLNYAHTALIGIEVDAQKFGSTFPERVYEVGGILIDYPSNYNPNTRAYTGIWDGTFTRGQRCDNPAWVIWDLATKGRYGLGNMIKAAGLDKWALYSIAQYCDELIDDGDGGTEPRFTFNGVIETREDAAKLLDRLSSVFRGMLYWSAGAITFTNDAPSTETPKVVNRANVLGGQFHYSAASKRARHSTVIVSWNDPAKLGEVNYEYVSRDELILRYGYRPIELAAMGCTSRGQAHRMGEWLLDTEANEGELLTYRASFDHAKVRPGQLIEVYDPWYAGARLGGRILEGDASSVTLDQPYTVIAGVNLIRLAMPDGTIAEREITNPIGAATVITFASAMPDNPVKGAVYGIANDDINPRMFRVVAGTMKEPNVFEINAQLHDPTKYDRIERGLTLTPPSYTGYDATVLTVPTDLNITETRSDNGDEYATSAVLSWTPADDARVTKYGLQILDADDIDEDDGDAPIWQEEIIIEGTSFSYDEVPLGPLQFRVRSLSDTPTYTPSDYVTSAVETIVGYPDPTAYVALTAVGKFRRVVLKFAENTDEKFRRARLWASETNDFTTATIVDFAPAGVKRLIHDDLGKKETWYYWIDAQDKYGRNSTRYPNTTTGVSATTVPVNDDDTDDDLKAAPTALSVTKVQIVDDDGKVNTFLRLNCTPPGWATDKTEYIYEIEVQDDDTYQVIPKSTKARFTVKKTGKLHTVRVKAKEGAGARSGWTSTLSITPSKKGTTAAAIAGISINRKNGENVIKWTWPTDADNRAVILQRDTSSGFPSPQEIYRGTVTRYRDTDNIVKGTTYHYRLLPLDTSGNIGALASSSVSQAETGLTLTDTDTTLLAAPTGISLTQSNRDVDRDGSVDIMLKSTFSGSVANASGYECEYSDDLGNIKTERADGGYFWFVASTVRSYRVRWRTYTWNGQPGAWSSYVGPVTPSPITGAPSAPVGFFAFNSVGRIGFSFNAPTEFDYAWTEIAIGGTSDLNVAHTTTARFGEFSTSLLGATTVYARHVNTSGVKSSWAGSSATITAPSKLAVSVLGSSAGSVNAGTGDQTLLLVTFTAASNTTGISITLGSRTWNNVEFVNNMAYTFQYVESGGGSFSFSKSGGGSFSGVTLSAFTVD